MIKQITPVRLKRVGCGRLEVSMLARVIAEGPFSLSLSSLHLLKRTKKRQSRQKWRNDEEVEKRKKRKRKKEKIFYVYV